MRGGWIPPNWIGHKCAGRPDFVPPVDLSLKKYFYRHWIHLNWDNSQHSERRIINRKEREPKKKLMQITHIRRLIDLILCARRDTEAVRNEIPSNDMWAAKRNFPLEPLRWSKWVWASPCDLCAVGLGIYYPVAGCERRNIKLVVIVTESSTNSILLLRLISILLFLT